MLYNEWLEWETMFFFDWFLFLVETRSIEDWARTIFTRYLIYIMYAYLDAIFIKKMCSTYMLAYIHTCIHTYIHTHTHARIHTHTHIYIHINIYAYIKIYFYICIIYSMDGFLTCSAPILSWDLKGRPSNLNRRWLQWTRSPGGVQRRSTEECCCCRGDMMCSTCGTECQRKC